MDFFTKNGEMMELFLGPLHGAIGELDQNLKQLGDKFNRAEKDNLSLIEENADLKQKLKHQEKLQKNHEYAMEQQEKKLKEFEMKIKEQQEKIEMQEKIIKNLHEQNQQLKSSVLPTATKVQSESRPSAATPPVPKITTTAPSFFQTDTPAIPSATKVVIKGLIGIRIGVNYAGRASIFGIDLVFSDSNGVKELKNLFKQQKPYPIYGVGSHREMKQYEHLKVFAGKDQYKCSFEFIGNSDASLESVEGKDKYKGYILMREFEKYVDTANIQKFYWNMNKEVVISEETLPEDLRQSAFDRNNKQELSPRKSKNTDR